ncbi:MAG: orotate phosphoribosyltransferase [Acidimicrobiales bacterium]|nr:orotate phosphoribosyltransferase [Acidimicrobiales bacterium]
MVSDPQRPSKVALIKLLSEKAYMRSEEPFQLASGAWSHDYVDCRRAMALGSDLGIVAAAVVEQALASGVTLMEKHSENQITEVQAVGGLTMGADPISHAVALVTGLSWFSVRKNAKSHGVKRAIEGAQIERGAKVLVVDDVVTSGSSIIDAIDAVIQSGGEVVLAMALLDRSYATKKAMEAMDIPYVAIATFEDLGIEPVEI